MGPEAAGRRPLFGCCSWHSAAVPVFRTPLTRQASEGPAEARVGEAIEAEEAWPVVAVAEPVAPGVIRSRRSQCPSRKRR